MNILRFIERLNPEHRKHPADDFARDVHKRFRERSDSESVANPIAVLNQIARRERWRHPFHWFKFLKFSRRPQTIGKYEKLLQETKPK